MRSTIVSTVVNQKTPGRRDRMIVLFSWFLVALLPGRVDASAQPLSTEALIERLELLEARVHELEALLEDKTEAARSAEPATAETSTPDAPLAEINGTGALFLPSRGHGGGALHYGETTAKSDLHAFLDLEYVDAGPDGSRSGVSTFDNHHALVFLRSQLRPGLLAHVEIEYEHSGDVVEIDQGYVSWHVDDAFTLDAGRFYTPFGIERFVWYSPTNAMVSRPTPMSQIVPGNFYANGLKASGLFKANDQSLLTYELSVSDGLGDDALVDRRGSRQTRDNNSNRALSGRLAYVRWPNFEIGASYHTQRYASTADLDLRFFGVDVAARWAGWELRGEYLEAAVEQGFEDAGGIFRRAADLEQDGWYLQLAYSFLWDRALLPSLTLASRYDVLDRDASTTGDDDQRLWALGVNFELYPHYRLKLEHQWLAEDGEPRDDNAFLLQMVLDF